MFDADSMGLVFRHFNEIQLFNQKLFDEVELKCMLAGVYEKMQRSAYISQLPSQLSVAMM
jgi:hypothetical protein